MRLSAILVIAAWLILHGTAGYATWRQRVEGER